MGAASSSTFEDDFHLLTLETNEMVILGFDVTVPCFLSPGSPVGAKDMEIRWFKETDCVCLYKNKQLIAGLGYENRVSMFTEGLNNVSLTLHFFRWSDVGYYTCQVTSGDRTKEITVRLGKQNIFYRYKHMADGAVAAALAILIIISEVKGASGVGITVGAAGVAAAAAAAVNITFLKKDRPWTELERLKIELSALLAETQRCLAEKDKLMITEILKNQLTTLKIELQDTIKKLQEEIKNKKETYSQLKNKMGTTTSNNFQDDFYLRTYEGDQITLGSDVTVPCYLPHSAIDMEVGWFKETDCICLYKNRQVVKGRGYENRGSLSTAKLMKGNLSLTLQYFTKSDAGDYMCQVTSGDETNEITVRVEKQSLLHRFVKTADLEITGVLVILVMLTAAAGGVAATVIIAAAAVIAAAAATVSNITFTQIYRAWSDQERKKMEKSALFAETIKCLSESEEKLKRNFEYQLGTLKVELQAEIRQLQKEVERLKGKLFLLSPGAVDADDWSGYY